MSSHPPEASRNPIPPLRVAVAGGGAAGMIAAWRAAGLGHAVTLLEANERLGTKILISGGGKCNITHAGPVPELLRAFPPAQARFLRPGLHEFDNAEVLELLRREGVVTQARDNGRVFPLDRPGSAALVTAAFEALVRRAGVAVRLGARVLGWLAALGGPVTPWFPALAPIPLRRPRPAWEGVALRGGALQLRAGPGGKLLAAHTGDILFTRAGISGPAALELSRAVEAARRSGEAWLGYAIANQGEAPLEAELLDLQGGNPHLAARTWLQRWLPERLCGPALEEAGLPADQRMNDLPRAGRKALLALVLAFPLGEPGPVDLERGEVSAGGVRLEAVEPRTMALKGWDNLRVCGELLDIDGPVGGYNLQAAFSTGYLAGCQYD